MKFEMILFGKVSGGQGYSEIWRAGCERVFFFWLFVWFFWLGFFFFRGEIQLKQRGLCHFKCCDWVHCLGAVWKWEEWGACSCSPSSPGVWTSSAQHIQISLKGEQPLWQLCSSLLSWKSKAGGQESRGVALALLLGVSRQFWGKHPWLVCVWSVQGQRVRGAVHSSCAECGCSTPCWALQRSLEASPQPCWILENRWMSPGAAFYWALLKWRISKQFGKRFLGVVSNLSYSVQKLQGNQKLGTLVLGNIKTGSETWL